MSSQPQTISREEINAFKAAGYKSMVETQVIWVETEKYFRYLISIITVAGGSLELGTLLSKLGISKRRQML